MSMAPGLPRSGLKSGTNIGINIGLNSGLKGGFNSSRLVRFLTELVGTEAAAGSAVAAAAASKQSFAERLGLWLDWPDAISLAAALNKASAASGLNDPGAAATATDAVFKDYSRVCADLTKAIVMDGLLTTGQTVLKRPITVSGAALATVLEFSAYRRSYLGHQRLMAAAIGPLRGRVRAALPGLSPALGRLAALDAVLDDALQARERQLLSKLPWVLEKHFERLREAHRASAEQGQRLLLQATPAQPAAWLADYCKDMQGLLLAELALRLQPIEAMMEAMGYELTRRQ